MEQIQELMDSELLGSFSSLILHGAEHFLLSIPESAPKHEFPQVTTTTNFDILKRLNRLEKEVFGKQVVDRDF